MAGSDAIKKEIHDTSKSTVSSTIKSMFSSISSMFNSPKVPLMTKMYKNGNEEVVVRLMVEKDRVVNLTSQDDFKKLSDEHQYEIAMEQAISFMQTCPGQNAEITGTNNPELNAIIGVVLRRLIKEATPDGKAQATVTCDNNLPDEKKNAVETWISENVTKLEYSADIQGLKETIIAINDKNNTQTKDFKQQVGGLRKLGNEQENMEKNKENLNPGSNAPNGLTH